MKVLARAAWLGVLFPLAHPALAADCGTLQRVASVDLVPYRNSSIMLVPVSINGTPRQLVLNTAGARTTLTHSTAESLNLHGVDTSGEKLLSTNGNTTTLYAKVDSFEIGKIGAKNVDFLIMPDSGNGASGIDGSLAGDLLDRFDVEIDFSARKLNFFSPDHCAGQVIYWPAQAVAVTPFTQNRQAREPLGFGMLGDAHTTHIRVPVTLDGKDFFADINTASGDSTMTAATAKYVFGVTADSPGAVPLGQMGGDPANKRFGYVFKSLTFDGISVSNAHFIVLPDLTGAKDRENEYATGGHLQRADDGIASEITVGLDVLKHLHLYIAYGEKKLYLTPAAPPPDAPKP